MHWFLWHPVTRMPADEKFSLFADFVRKKEDFIQPYLDVYRIQEVAHRYTGFSLPEERTSQN